MANAVSPCGKAPFNIEMGTAYATGAAFETSFIGYADPVFFKPVDIGRTKVEAGLVLALARTDCAVDNSNVGLLVNAKPV